jgi:glycosyltransferase involved in cell wall biosynthesis
LSKVSICIPTFECGGHGSSYLETLLDSIALQTYDDLEIIISDHSDSNTLQKLCDNYALNIVYVKNTKNRGSSEANLNNAIKAATGKYIKPMYQDDFFFDKNAIQVMVSSLEESTASWVAATTLHCQDQNSKDLFYPHSPQLPHTTDAWLLGKNTIGSPSVVMYLALDQYLDPFLVWLPDVEFYYRLWEVYGPPALVPTACIVTRLREDGITNTEITPDVAAQEAQYNKDKHSSDTTLKLNHYPIIYSRASRLKLL